MEVSFVLMEPYHRLLRKKEWSPRDYQHAVYLNESEDLCWTEHYRGLSSSVHLVAVELDYRIREKNYTELSMLRELEYGEIYQDFDQGTSEENRIKRKGWFYLCDTHALVQRLLQEET
jgi:hypothetical protein